MKDKIHMRQKPGLYCWGWTYCGLDVCAKRTNRWDKVTCKNCLKIKRREENDKI
jgi:hypothetical protein